VAPSVAGSVSGKKSDKVLDPPIFTNSEAEDKLNFEDWYDQIEAKLHVNADRFDSDYTKLAYIRSRVRGEVA
jgi:hypothetical protein